MGILSLRYNQMVDREQLILPKVDLDPVRSRITKLTSRIIFKLEDRSGFPLNPPVYEPGALPLSDGSNLSFLEYAVKGLEEYHGSLGRWDFPEEYPLMISVKPTAITHRTVDGTLVLPNVDINLKNKLLSFYIGTLLPRLCEPKDDPSTYGETVYIDADVVELLNERMNLGRYVAVSKVNNDSFLWNLVSEPEKLDEALRDRNREKVVIDAAMQTASRLGLDVALTADLARWIIDTTTDLEVKYLQGLYSPSRD